MKIPGLVFSVRKEGNCLKFVKYYMGKFKEDRL